jgi:hypothetical protein
MFRRHTNVVTELWVTSQRHRISLFRDESGFVCCIAVALFSFLVGFLFDAIVFLLPANRSHGQCRSTEILQRPKLSAAGEKWQ